MKVIISDCPDEMQGFIFEVHPYDSSDKKMLASGSCDKDRREPIYGLYLVITSDRIMNRTNVLRCILFYNYAFCVNICCGVIIDIAWSGK